MNKDHLRREASKTRELIQPHPDDTKQAAAHFLTTIKPDKTNVIAGYAPKGREFDAMDILEILHHQGFQCALPRMIKGSRILEFHEWTPGSELIPNSFEIFEPAPDAPALRPDILLVPLLAFDRSGHRLGYGGGYYDATLSHLRKTNPRTLAIGIAYAKQACLFNLPSEEHDQPLDWVITPQQAHYFGHKNES